MNSVALEPIAVPFNDDSIKLIEVVWLDSDSTKIKVFSKRSGRMCAVEFQNVIGLRILDELDVAALWLNAPRESLTSSWLFKINAGGWYELESTRNDFYTKHEDGVFEFLIAGYQECLSVLSYSIPLVAEISEKTSA